MPVISLFYGLIISMYYLDNKQHHLPHMHLKHNEFESVFSIPAGDILESKLPSNKIKLVKAWIEIGQEDLMAD